MNKSKLTKIAMVQTLAIISCICLTIAFILLTTQLIPRSQSSKIIIKLSTVATAIDRFYNQYHSMPADITNATSYWTINDFNSKCSYVTFIDKKTIRETFSIGVNGNGTGFVDMENIAQTNDTDAFFKPSSYLCHLRLARLIPNSFKTKTIVQNIKAANYNVSNEFNSGMLVVGQAYITLYGSKSGNKEINSGNNLYIISPEKSGKTTPSSIGNAKINTKIFKAINEKIDNGLPGSGKIRALSNPYSKNGYKYKVCCNKLNGRKCAPDSKFINKNSKNSCYLFYALPEYK
ncbi:hypothetical protein CAXC1_330065 [Candidatus Xenohaliotis californiensis]|uniref:Type II secretion system protein n=1 Tax=Candidatus Xenohaliotis californiensis TaxID=84677 RepID=A0ABM9N8S2_9RICK|nr:hypothetical protein CAXC1_330065 [Candidatus Xenohaliotis californiensis]